MNLDFHVGSVFFGGLGLDRMSVLTGTYPHLNFNHSQNNKQSWAWWLKPIIPAPGRLRQENAAGEIPEHTQGAY